MKAEHKLQLDVIKGERIFFKQYGDFTFLSDGKIGVYLEEDELKIDKQKMIEIQSDSKVSFDPNVLFNQRKEAWNTGIRRKYRISDLAIQLKAYTEDTKCFVDKKFLDMFGSDIELYIKSDKEPILVMKYGIPYGIIMPVFFRVESNEKG